MKYAKLYTLLIIILSAALLLTACRKDDEPPVDDPPDEANGSQVHEDPPVQHEHFVFTYENFPRLDGSPATAPLAQAAACVLLGESRENVADMTIFTRTTQAFRNLAAGESDILIAGEPTPDVLSDLDRQGFNIEMAPIAIDALVFVVSASNPVDNLTTEQLREIYTGTITNWQQLGGNNSDIEAFQRNEEAMSQVLMQKLVMDWQPMADAPTQIFSTDFEMGDSISAIKGFDGSEGAIGYTMFYYADVMEIAAGLKVLSIDGVIPGAETIKNGQYPLLNPYYAVISADEPEDGPVRIMFNWLKTEDGQNLISRQGYVSLMESSQSEAISLPNMRWTVRTDDSKLTPFKPHTQLTRLSSGKLTELIPSATYGKVLPYSSAATLNDGSLRIAKYGLVTTDGMILTDLIYDSIVMATFVTTHSSEQRPAYYLRKGTPAYEFMYEIQTQNAACAPDGSWVTSFDYVDIVFSDEVIFLMRDHETFDIDVYNYSGVKLYNILELEWANEISDDTWAEVLVYGVSEGHGFVKLNDGTYGLMDAKTGAIIRADFEEAFMFSEGLAAVVPGDGQRWGFVNRNLEMVIQPEFMYATAFIHGRAVVEKPDGSQHIINNRGESLFSVTKDYFIINNHDGNGFSVHAAAGWDIPTFYTNDFVQISYPADTISLGPESILQYIGSGWYLCMTDDGTWLFTSGESYLLPQDRFLFDFIDGYIIYMMFNDDFTIISYGVMLPDGTDIILPDEFASITPVTHEGSVRAFIINTNTTYGQFVNETYIQARYTLVDVNGNIIKTGAGIMVHDRALDLLSVQGTDFSAWMDMSGNTIISVPSMGYSFD
ncbi:MAG: substrate-binding domain-containing protein [Oscillospiraceae bacterium]|nr:substrate-binding domain-containing protein [Oscillospiraceae bacterium]